MKYLFKTLIITIIIFLCLKLVFYSLNNNHEVQYNLGNFKVTEKFKLKDKRHIYNFYIENGNYNIAFEIDQNFKKASKIIERIEFFKKDQCLLPIFKRGKIIYDAMCKKQDTIYFANELNKNLNLGNYKTTNFEDKAKGQKYEVNDIYMSNILKNHYLYIENYKGIVLINNNISTIKLFDNDVYKKEISTTVDKFYLVANYNENLTFKSFFLINLINGKQREIRSVNAISFDSYIQGVVDNQVYLFDKDSQTQYKIDLDTELVTKVTALKNIKYYDGKWKTMTLKEAMEGKLFNKYYSNKFNNYIKTDKVNNKYYVYEKQDKYYNVYLINDKNERIYLFKTSDMNSVTYLSNTICFKLDNSYYLYSNNGNKKLITNFELEFNDTIKFGVYEK